MAVAKKPKEPVIYTGEMKGPALGKRLAKDAFQIEFDAEAIIAAEAQKR